MSQLFSTCSFQEEENSAPTACWYSSAVAIVAPNPSRVWPQHLLRWLDCLEKELSRQGDKERAAGLPVGPLFDRSKPGVSESQVGFFEMIVLPLFQVGGLKV